MDTKQLLSKSRITVVGMNSLLENKIICWSCKLEKLKCIYSA